LKEVAGVVDLFVYGSLLDDAVVVEVTGRRFPRRAAQLRGYRKHTPVGSYPYVVPDDDGTVDGVVLQGIDADTLRALDAYEDEGQLYRRVEVTVTVAGQPQRAFVYAAAR
jgi:gamma-glutamylaminecyclotransferase